MKKILLSALVSSLLVACSSNKEPTAKVEEKIVQPERVVQQDPPPTVPTRSEPQETRTVYSEPVKMDPLDDPNSILAKRSVYYPFDVSSVQDSDKPVVQAHAKYLTEHTNRKVRLEGNCDERGSNEYNLALGQRRADGVKKMMEMSGVASSQLESVSYGEEKPKATGHDESAWQQNRRTDINYTK